MSLIDDSVSLHSFLCWGAIAQHQNPETLLTDSAERPPQAEQDFHLLDLDQFFPSLETDWCIDPFSL